MSPPDAGTALARRPGAASRSQQLLSGWGRTAPTRAWVLRPRDLADAESLVREGLAGSGGLIARGAGLSYGDAAQNGGGSVLDANSLRGEPLIDRERRLVSAGAGTTLGELLERLAEQRMTLPVVPGTARLTVGGAIASDVHGKNHLRDGSFAAHVSSFTLATPAAGTVEVTENETPELFAATLGGMGLTGVILEATLKTAPLRSRLAEADFDPAEDLAHAIALMSEDTSHRYAIAWVDLLARGSLFGRAVVTRSRQGNGNGNGDGERESSPGARAGSHQREPVQVRPRFTVPERFPAVLRPATVRAFNAWRWQRHSRLGHGRTLSMSANLFPLDSLGEWNRLYGRAGLVQYQFAVPAGSEDTLLAVLDALRGKRVPMYLAVLKRFGAPSAGLLSFPIEGWTIAIDIPAEAPGLADALAEQDARVADCGGRIYLAKDALARAEVLASMYPQLQRFLQVRAEVDPDGTLRSDLARRLGL